MAIYRVVAVLIAYLVLAWLTGTLLHLRGADLWILRGGLALLGLIGAAAFLWFQHRLQAEPGSEPAAAGAGDGDLDLIVRDARARLKASKIGRQWGLGQLPLLYLLGDTGSTKTSIIVHSGLDPELLAGHVYHDNLIVSTRGANVWYTRQALFVDSSGALLDQPSLWRRLLKRLQPSRLAAIGRGRQAPHAALVCVDCEALLQASTEALGGLARKLAGALQEIARVLAIEFPVYVLFTRADRVPQFAEYVRSLSKEEGADAFGATLPLAARPAGVYAEQQTRNLTQAFDELFCCAAAKRLDLLARENEPENLPGVYQFPRELRKLRRNLVQFLVDLLRPSQLSSNPFLRGFYFCGARASVVEEVVVEARPVSPQPSVADATMAFRPAEFRQAAAPAPARVSRKVPEWMFLTHLFNDVILKDQVALGTSGLSSKTSLVRRLLLAAATCIALVLSIGFLVSFIGNRGLRTEVAQAIRATPDAEVPAGQVPSLDDLHRLDALRQTAAKLAQYEREGAPLGLRWGLFTGHRLYPEARKVYFDRFRKMLFAGTQAALLASLQRLPAAPRPADDYDAPYQALKAYLITTSHHEQSTVEFLSPALLAHWIAGQPAEPAVADLARKQFEFYSAELKLEDPYSLAVDAAAVERARAYLAQFAGSERLYRFMLGEASRANPSINYNRMFPGSAEVLIAGRDVEGAFTKAGWNYVQDALAHLERFFAGEEWVLGPSGAPALNRVKLQQELQARYREDFIQRWRSFLEGAAVVRYGGAKDAARKLGIFAGNQSPLLALFSVVSQNTAVNAEEITAKFQPVQAVVPAGGGERYVGSTNAAYMTALIGLQTAMEQVAGMSSTTSDRTALDPARGAAASAKQAAYQLAQGFTVDTTTHIDGAARRLLEAPVKYAEDVLNEVGGDLNGKARTLCARFRELGSEFPFNPAAGQQVSVQELNGIFQPRTGALWVFYEQNLKTLVQRRGASFVAGPGSANLNPAFLAFFNRAVAFSETVYASNAAQPRLAFRLKPQSMAGLQALTLAIAGQTVGTTGGAKPFTWQWGDRDQVKLVGKMGGTEFTFLTYSGPWSLFQFFASAERSRPAGAAQRYEWVPKTSGQPFMTGGRPLTVSYELEMSGAAVFQKGYFAQMQCVAQATR